MSDRIFLKRPKNFLSFLRKLLLARWQSLLLLFFGMVLPLFIFEQLAVVIWQNQDFSWDDSILLAIHQTATPELDRFVSWFTQLGVYRGVVPAVIAISIGLLYGRRWRSLAFLLTTTLGSAVINRVAKALLHRIRPSLWNSVSPELDYGFPSGHAMSSMSFVAALVILTWGTRWCWLVLLSGGLFVGAIGWSRLYLGVHFPSDVLAGWMVSLAWAIGVSLVIRPHLIKPSLVSEQALTVSEEKAVETK
ncbi:phosphatase PAP2 family protein [Kovacikia minuta CCNUW1]|uniref:phosphatase PAP2 family protein n=1 Tax=Kovacikia minuta TaxID=2931930 RepID=UPI001CCC5B06|nr:phosphatase PAP2 family protein [Kovacikia minuta]UBF25870.1 phosphatase PAP2 family protein [Kovacikia minuta CCNUW1]